MTSFDEREKAHENKFAHDEEAKFRAQSRAIKMFGDWLEGEAGFDEDYSVRLVNQSAAGKKPADIINIAHADVRAAGKNFGKDMLQEKFNIFLAKAHEETQKS